MINLGSVEGFDYGKRKEGGEYSFVPRTIESVRTEELFDAQFNNAFDAIKSESSSYRYERGLETNKREKKLEYCGEILGVYMSDGAMEDYHGEGESVNEAKAGAIFQGFLERQLLKRGNIFIQLLREPAFLTGLKRTASFLPAEKINEFTRGANSTVEYIHKVERDPQVVFIGSESNLDMRHAIDLVIGRSENPTEEEPQIDEIVLVQVKTLQPSAEAIAKINRKHKEYAKALQELEGLGVGTTESNRFTEHTQEGDNELIIQKTTELGTFYNSLNALRIISEQSWEALVQDAEKYGCDPMLFYMRIKSINEARLNLVQKSFKRNMLTMAKDALQEIVLPQEVAAAYNRITRGRNYIGNAKRFISQIIANNEVISETVLTE